MFAGICLRDQDRVHFEIFSMIKTLLIEIQRIWSKWIEFIHVFFIVKRILQDEIYFMNLQEIILCDLPVGYCTNSL